ncbi:MAG: aspartate carbamoyltransferase catalytic subunit [Desulfovibrio sp.]|nr:aspartate carbamoyltransferase catalytic subunit [Desulfovibrio sp.]
MSETHWPHKDLLDVEDLSLSEIIRLLDMAARFKEINERPVKKVPTLRGRGIILFFAEPSTRTKTSFDVAGKRLSADTFSLAVSGSSITKGESLKDTALTLQAMSPDIIVIRHSSSGAAAFLAERLDCSVVNAGDGRHAHPTQALLDAFTLREHWGADMSGKTLLIAGDIAHSRVARSNVLLWNKLGVSVRVFGPRTLLPPGISTWPAKLYDNLEEAVKGVDAIMGLRLQLERQQAGLLPDLSEYAQRFCIGLKHLSLAAPEAVILHPGPINRGLEISAEAADSAKSRILDQVAAGVALRMAVLFTLAMRNEVE